MQWNKLEIVSYLFAIKFLPSEICKTSMSNISHWRLKILKQIRLPYLKESLWNSFFLIIYQGTIVNNWYKTKYHLTCAFFDNFPLFALSSASILIAKPFFLLKNISSNFMIETDPTLAARLKNNFSFFILLVLFKSMS